MKPNFRHLIKIALTATSFNAWSYSQFPTYLDTAAKALYNGSYNSSCAACHGNSGYSLATQFGVSFKSTGATAAPGVSMAALTQAQTQTIVKAMENLDSDGDGANNKAEFTAGTNPADANSKPVTQPVCSPAKPTFTISPASQSAAAGGSVSYTLSLKNNDSTACASSTFAVAGSAPSGFTASSSLGSVVLNAGASTSISLNVKSPVGQTAGNFSIGAQVSDSAQSVHSATVSGTYIVQAVATCTRSAPLVSFSPSSQSGAPGSSITYKLTVSNKDSSICAASTFAVSVNALSPLSAQASMGSLNLTAGQSGTVDVVVKAEAGAAASSNSFSAAVTDSALSGHNGSAQGQFVITGSTGGGDMTAPSAPTNVKVNAWKGFRLVRWTRSTDNVKVVKYQVLVDGQLHSEVTGNWALIRVRNRNVQHTLTIRALDAAGNVSMDSSPVTLAPRHQGSEDRDDESEGPEHDRH